MIKSEEFQRILLKEWPELNSEALDAWIQYRELVLKENEIQNLTRIIEPLEFYENHCLDVKSLYQSGFVNTPAMDLGSGLGIPGLGMAFLEKSLGQNSSWILAESESRKADFLNTCVKALGLGDRVEVFGGRAEDCLRQNKVESIAVRAVGTVDKLYKNLRKRSTWNTLILLKSLKWEEEWKNFLSTPFSKELVLEDTLEYSTPTERKYRIIVKLKRVPRGT